MNKYSERSKRQFDKMHPALQCLFLAVLSRHDHTLIESHRGEKRQTEYFVSGASSLPYPKSKHNLLPSLAIDASPYIQGSYSEYLPECAYFGALVLETSKLMGIPIRWGGDWDGDLNMREHKLKDLWHFEIDVKAFRNTAWFQAYGL